MSDRHLSDRLAFAMFIESSLAAHPDWLDTALASVTAGMSAALSRANERCSKYDLAFRSALALADPGRMSSGSKEILNTAIVNAIEPLGACKTEEDFLKRLANEGEPGGDKGHS